MAMHFILYIPPQIWLSSTINKNNDRGSFWKINLNWCNIRHQNVFLATLFREFGVRVEKLISVKLYKIHWSLSVKWNAPNGNICELVLQTGMKHHYIGLSIKSRRLWSKWYATFRNSDWRFQRERFCWRGKIEMYSSHTKQTKSKEWNRIEMIEKTFRGQRKHIASEAC